MNIPTYQYYFFMRQQTVEIWCFLMTFVVYCVSQEAERFIVMNYLWDIMLFIFSLDTIKLDSRYSGMNIIQKRTIFKI